MERAVPGLSLIHISFGEDQIYDQKDSAGFIHLFGLPITVQAKLKQNWEE